MRIPVEQSPMRGRRLYNVGFPAGKPTLALGEGKGKVLNVQVNSSTKAALSTGPSGLARRRAFSSRSATARTARSVIRQHREDPYLKNKYRLGAHELTTLVAEGGTSGSPVMDRRTGAALGLISLGGYETSSPSMKRVVRAIAGEVALLPKKSAAVVRSWPKTIKR
jgi:hypothetical protein